METTNLEISEIRLSFSGGTLSGPRAEQISRATMEHLQRLVESELNTIDRNITLDHLEVPPLQTSFDTLDDQAISRASADQIFRALLAAL